LQGAKRHPKTTGQEMPLLELSPVTAVQHIWYRACLFVTVKTTAASHYPKKVFLVFHEIYRSTAMLTKQELWQRAAVHVMQ